MKVLIGLLCLIVVYLQVRLWTGTGSVTHMNQLAGEIAAQTLENDDLALRNEQLYIEIHDLKTGLDALEDHARSELGMIREGEVFYMLVGDDKAHSAEYTRDH